MKRFTAVSLSAIMLISGLMPVTVDANPSADAIINEVINKVMTEKSNGNSLYYDLMIGYKDQIDKTTLQLLYNTMLTDAQRTKIESDYGNVTTGLNDLNDSDIAKIKNRIDAIAPSSGGSGSTGGGTPVVTPPKEDIKEEKPVVVEENPKEEKPPVKVLFKDISSLWLEAQDAIGFMAGRGVLQGKAEGIFAPQDSITRAEFAKTIVTLLELNNDATKLDKSFNDVAKSHWYYNFVQIAFKHGIIEGKNDTTFAPNDLITRQEMAVMIARTMRAMEKAEILLPLQAKEMLNIYEDNNQVANWAEQDIALVVKNKIIQGKAGRFIAPKDNATRAEAVVILKRLFDLLNN